MTVSVTRIFLRGGGGLKTFFAWTWPFRPRLPGVKFGENYPSFSPFNRHIKTAEQYDWCNMIIQQYDWCTGRWWVGCYIWYREERTGRAAAPPSPLLAVPNVTAHLSTPSVPTSYYSMLQYNTGGFKGRALGVFASSTLWVIDAPCVIL